MTVHFREVREMKSMARRYSSSGFTLIELLIVVAIIGIIAAIAIPGLLRARVSANEAATVGDIRSVISAEAAYHSATGGYYGTLSCLLLPTGAGCIPSYPATAPTFIDSLIASMSPKSGYARTMDETAAVPRGLTCYVYQATPVNLGQTGVRGLAGDCSGRVCFTPNGLPIPSGGPGVMLQSCTSFQ
jgi:prepilin-type N-terminal cleavage/methylation domain-containing protein